MIYLDYAASTPIAPEVAKIMIDCISDTAQTGQYANPSSLHAPGVAAKKSIEAARQSVADLLHATPEEIIFTSGATESINTALKGVIYPKLQNHQPCHIITSQIEHSATLETCRHLAKLGAHVTYLKPDHRGQHTLEKIKAAMKPETCLVSLHWVNNEVAAIQPIRDIGQYCREKGILLHTDAVQAAGKIPIDVIADHIDLLSLSAHKFYGPKGIGALYVRKSPQVRISPLHHGSGHERGYRAGTLPTHQILGLGAAAKLVQSKLSTEPTRLKALKLELWHGIKQLIPTAEVNGDLDLGAPHILSVVLPGVDRDALQQKVACSFSSACHSSDITVSFVLLAMDIPVDKAKQSVRFSMGLFTDETDIKGTLSILEHCLS